MLFADDPSAIDDTPLQDVGRSLFLFFFNYLDVVFSFACFYAWHFRNEGLELPHYFSFYNTVPFSFLGQMKISNNITVSLHRTIAAEFAIVMFLFLVILVKFIEPFGKRSSSCVRK
jgi:hypothetical protein